MITEIPTSDEFYEAGLNQLHLAWQIAMQIEFESAEVEKSNYDLEEKEAAEISDAYWTKCQPVLANAFGLIQQAMEMALKGRIASVSPYLLISRDPKDWPSGVESRDVPFSDFRTLDSADLLKVHNTFYRPLLSDQFRTFWEGVRRDRNKIMHSVAVQKFNSGQLIKDILTAATELFSSTRWPQQLLEMEASGRNSFYGFGYESNHNIVMGQIESAIELLNPAESKRFFGFDPRKRAYTCPACYQAANRDWQDVWPKLAQFITPGPEARLIKCSVCETETNVDRRDCVFHDCAGNVIYDSYCLTCLGDQQSPGAFRSGLEEDLSIENKYSFQFRRGLGHTYTDARFSSDARAVEHARQALAAPFLASWDLVTILRGRSPMANIIIGTWVREQHELLWLDKFEPELMPFLALPEKSGTDDIA